MRVAYTGRLPEVEALLCEHATVVPFGESADLCVSAIGTHIFTPHEIAAHPLGIVNLHLAPLPEFRGRHSAAHAIAGGSPSFGVTLHYVDEGIDTGPIIAEARFGIDPDWTVDHLRAMARGAGIVLARETLPRLVAQSHRVPAYSQDPARARYFRAVAA